MLNVDFNYQNNIVTKDNNMFIDNEIKEQSNKKNYLNSNDMKKATDEAIIMINSSKTPLIVAGIEIQRFKLQKKLLELIDKTNIPFVSTILSKSVLSENHPLFLGVYEGDIGIDSVRK